MNGTARQVRSIGLNLPTRSFAAGAMSDQSQSCKRSLSSFPS